MIKTAFIGIFLISLHVLSAQTVLFDGEGYFHHYPPTSVINGETYWCEMPIKKVVERAEVIFEGRILSDAIVTKGPNDDNEIFAYRVLVLKQFKGKFSSDTIIVQNDLCCYMNGDEDLYFLRSYSNAYHTIGPLGCDRIGICNRKDIKEKIYDPLITALGKNYIEVHPDICPPIKKGR